MNFVSSDFLEIDIRLSKKQEIKQMFLGRAYKFERHWILIITWLRIKTQELPLIPDSAEETSTMMDRTMATATRSDPYPSPAKEAAAPAAAAVTAAAAALLWSAALSPSAAEQPSEACPSNSGRASENRAGRHGRPSAEAESPASSRLWPVVFGLWEGNDSIVVAHDLLFSLMTLEEKGSTPLREEILRAIDEMRVMKTLEILGSYLQRTNGYGRGGLRRSWAWRLRLNTCNERIVKVCGLCGVHEWVVFYEHVYNVASWVVMIRGRLKNNWESSMIMINETLSRRREWTGVPVNESKFGVAADRC